MLLIGSGSGIFCPYCGLLTLYSGEIEMGVGRSLMGEGRPLMLLKWPLEINGINYSGMN